jgi:hypothetical protein
MELLADRDPGEARNLALELAPAQRMTKLLSLWR